MFTKKDVKQAEHEMAEMIKKQFGEVWRIQEDGRYHGKSIDLKTMIPLDNALWLLCERARHAGALRAAGRIELRDSGDTLRLIIFYKPEVTNERLNNN